MSELYFLIALVTNLKYFCGSNAHSVIEKQLCICFWSFFGTKNSAFYFFATCTWLHGTIKCALHCHKNNLLLATSFVYPLLVSAAKTALTALALAANLHHFGTKNSAFYFLATCTWLHGTIWYLP